MIKTSLRVTTFTLVAIVCLFFAVRPSLADIEWTEKKQIKLEVSPIDMVTTPDGKWVIVLSSGEILVYSISEGKVINRMQVDKAYDKLAFSAADETIILSSSSGKTLKFVQMDDVHKFSLEGLPFKGPDNAAVTIVVFSDYQ
jgi:WD40 repeat protein